MFVSVGETARHGAKPMSPNRELAGKRVLVTGVTRHSGADLVAAFAEHKTRLIVNFAEESAPMLALAELAAPNATDLNVFHDALATPEAVSQFTRRAAQIHGGLDAVVNFVHLEAGELAANAGAALVEAHVGAKLMAPCLISRIAANRMALTWSEGVVLNALTVATGLSACDIALAGVTKAALAAMTRRQARDWADQAVRINAIAPAVADAGAERAARPTMDAGISALALYLTSRRGAKLSGHMFDADATAIERC